MNFYEIIPDFETRNARFFGCSETPMLDGMRALAQSPEKWMPHRDIRFEHGAASSYGALTKGGRLTADTVATLRAYYTVVEYKSGPVLDAVGSFSINLTDMPLVRVPLKLALAGLGDAVMEFVELTNVTDGGTGALLEGGPFWMVNVLDRRNGWDQDQSEIVQIKRKNGTYANAVDGTHCALRAGAVADGIIWRDSLTGNVLCSDRFRDVAMAAGCRGWAFREVRVAGAD